jgi:hypothetical protein
MGSGKGAGMKQGDPYGQQPRRFQFLTKFVIPSMTTDGDYLVRWRLIQTPWCSLYLHKILTADVPVFHDHPWSFLSVVLRGGYYEWRINKHNPQGEYVRHIKHVNIMRRDDAHFIQVLDRTPTWTLLLVGARRRKWGFLRRTMGPLGQWTWTPFDIDENQERFTQAMERRGK